MFSKLNNLRSSFQQIINNPIVRGGLPIICLTAVGAFVLIPINEIKYKEKEQKSNFNLLQKKAGVNITEINWEEEYEKIKAADTSNYKNIRGPRPWEDNSEFLESVKNKEKDVDLDFQEKLLRIKEREGRSFREYQELQKQKQLSASN